MKNKLQRQKRHIRVRRKVTGTEAMPRLSVYRSNKHIYAQLIDDTKKHTIVASTDIKVTKENNLDKAKEVGLNLAKGAVKKQIKKVVFDRGGFKYHGRVKALAEGAREGGLSF